MNKPAIYLISAFVLISFVCCSGKSSGEISTDAGSYPLNVVLMTLDTTRADCLGCYGNKYGATPNLDSLSESGIMFTKCFASTPLTLPSHASIMTGLNPYSHGVRNNGTYILADDVLTLAEIFRNNGYSTTAFIASYPLDSHFGLDQGFEIYDDSLLEGDRKSGVFFQERDATVIAEKAVRWIVANRSGKFFIWLHFFDPHMPYDPPSPYKERFFSNPYIGEIAHMDFNIGKIIRVLEEQGVRDKTLIAVVGDHGESLNEHGEDTHGFFAYNSTLHVPFILSLPGHLPSSLKIDINTGIIDLFPTVLSICKLEGEFISDGINLSDAFGKKQIGDFERNIYFETFLPYENFGWNNIRGIISGRDKYIRTTRKELYNIGLDWAEQQNIVDQYPDKLNEMRSALNVMLGNQFGNPRRANKKQMSHAELEKLRSLGYLGAGNSISEKSENLNDPKDMISVLGFIKAGEYHFSEKNWYEVIESFNRVLEVDEKCAYALTMQGKAYANLGEKDKAVESHVKALEISPGFYTAMTNLASVYSDTGKESEAIGLCEKVLAAHPADPIALTAMGNAYEASGNIFRAMECYEKAVEIDPYFFENQLKLGNLYAENGDFVKAETILVRLKDFFPDDDRIVVAIGDLYFRQGLYLKTSEYFLNILKDKPNKLIAYYYIGISSKRIGNIGDAQKYLKVFVENWQGKKKFLEDAVLEYESI